MVESWLREIDFLRALVDRWWAARELHERLDGVDVNTVFEDLRKETRHCAGIWDYAVSLRNQLIQLGDGHLKLGSTLQKAERRFRSNVSVRWVEETPILIAPPAGQENNQQAPRFSDRLVEVDESPVLDWLASFALTPASTRQGRRQSALQDLVWQERLPGEAPSPQQLILTSPDDRRREISVEWREQLQLQPTPNAVTAERLNGDVGLLVIRTFYCRDELGGVSDVEFRRQLEKAAEVIGPVEDLVVDIRENGGGRDEQAQLAAELLCAEQIEWFRYQSWNPSGPGLQAPVTTVWEPKGMLRCGPFKGRIWLLVGPATASTAEIFAAALQAGGRCQLVGAATAGSVGNPQEFRLPYSGLAVRIPITLFSIPCRDTPIEAHGLAPDIEASQTLADARRGHDTVLEELLESIRRC